MVIFSFSQQRDNDSVSGESGDEADPFNDPDDKWEKDFKLDSPSSRYVNFCIYIFNKFASGIIRSFKFPSGNQSFALACINVEVLI